MHRLLALGVLLLTPLAGRAAPVEISLFGFGASCSGIFCTSPSAFQLSGTLQAELTADLRLMDVQGMIGFRPLGSGPSGAFQVTSGAIDLDGDGDAGAIASFFTLAGGRTLYFPDGPVLGPANRFDGTHLYLLGSSWNPLSPPPLTSSLLIVGLVGRVRPGAPSGVVAPIPEPASAALLAAGGLLVGAAVRRRF